MATRPSTSISSTLSFVCALCALVMSAITMINTNRVLDRLAENEAKARAVVPPATERVAEDRHEKRAKHSLTG